MAEQADWAMERAREIADRLCCHEACQTTALQASIAAVLRERDRQARREGLEAACQIVDTMAQQLNAESTAADHAGDKAKMYRLNTAWHRVVAIRESIVSAILIDQGNTAQATDKTGVK